MGGCNTCLGRGDAKTVLLERKFVHAGGQQRVGQSSTTDIGGLGRDELGKPSKFYANSYTNSKAQQSAPTPAFGAPTPASAPTPGGPGYGATMYNAQTPAAMFTGRSDMPAETPAAYPPHERTGKTAFSKPLRVLFAGCANSQQLVAVFFTELDKNWLVDAAYAANKVGMMVKIRGSRGDSGGFPEWDHGKHESREGKLQGVLDTGSDYIPRTATLLMDDQDSLTVPIIYLVPIPPRLVRDKVVALDGRYKGQIVTVRDMMHDSCLVTHDDSMYDDLTHDRMCLYSDH